MAKNTTTTKNRTTPEQKMESVAASKTVEPKSIKIRMLHTFISNEYALFETKEYEIPTELAKLMIKNGDAEEC